MILQRLSQLYPSCARLSPCSSARNLGLTAVAFNKAKELDPVQKLFVEKLREYTTKSKSAGGVVDAGPEYQRNVNDELTKLQRLYGGGDLTKFPDFKFVEPKLEEVTSK